MPKSYRHQFLAVVRRNEAEMSSLFTDMAARARSALITAAGADGKIPPGRERDVKRAVQAAVLSYFLVPDSQGQPAAFEVDNRGKVRPLSPFMRALWHNIEDAVVVAGLQQAAIMRRRLQNYPMIVAAFERARINPIVVARNIVSEQVVFNPNVLARYDPPHLWVDQNGYRLSDRIWRVSTDTRRRIDLYLTEAIAEGRSSQDIADELERFLQPGRQLRRTNRPYGTDASFDAMRLGRTEITHAHASACIIAAEQNPFVNQVESRLSRSHPKRDVCDDMAENGPYPLDSLPATIPYHPHCLCYYVYVIDPESKQALQELRAQIEQGEDNISTMIGPLTIDLFKDMLLDEAIQIFAPPLFTGGPFENPARSLFRGS